MSLRTPSIHSQDDPLTIAIRPPPTETPLERNARLQREQEARRVSDEIDEEIRKERETLKKSKEDVKILLLGQAESGKSTLQKQFKLLYKPHALESERLSWKIVVYFNLVCSIRHIITTLDAWHEYDGPNSRSQVSISTPNDPDKQNQTSSLDSYQMANLRLRLSPLVATENQLAEVLSGGITVTGSGKGSVYARSGWQFRGLGASVRSKRSRTASSNASEKMGDKSEDPFLEDIANMLRACQEDIQALWKHPSVTGSIANRRLRLEAWETYFLDNIHRISARDYTPTTDDILHARIQTMGVVEDGFEVNIHGKLVNWRIYDVGGSRGQRHAWAPYFDEINAIIFVAPVSAFDQYLEEDPQTNRIDDSLQLFTQICSNQLLKKVHLVLFLNKTDLLQTKLAAGIRVKKYITSFGDRPNDFETVVHYFRAHFQQVHRKNNEKKRVLYTHFTSVINTKATQSIIENVRDSIFRGYLQSASLV